MTTTTLTHRKAYAGDTPRPGREVSRAWDWQGKVLTFSPPTYLKIRGERGTFRFIQHVTVAPHGRRRKAAEWIDVVGGTPGVVMDRAFYPDRIVRVLPRSKAS
jgi:hypothetical protein